MRRPWRPTAIPSGRTGRSSSTRAPAEPRRRRFASPRAPAPRTVSGPPTVRRCGVVANTLFNDVITLNNPDITMQEDDIAWRSAPRRSLWARGARFVPGPRAGVVSTRRVSCRT